jgi:hypothetical protein
MRPTHLKRHPSFPTGRGSPVRDFQSKREFIPDGHWVVPKTLIIEPGYAVEARTAWAFPTDTLDIGESFTFQLLSFPPVADSGTPGIGSVVVERVECEIFQLLDDLDLIRPVCNQIASPFSFEPESALDLTIGSGLIAGTTGTLIGTVISTTTGVTTPGVVTGSLPGYVITDLPHWCSFYQDATPNVSIGAFLYVSNWIDDLAQWEVRDPHNSNNAEKDDLLDYVYDVYWTPAFATSWTGRKWALSLPYPIMFGKGQSLHITFANNSDPFSKMSLKLMVYIRSYIREVA